MKTSHFIFSSATALLCGSVLWGQRVTAVSKAAVVKPVTVSPRANNITGTQTLIINRSRVLLDSVDGAGNRYFSVRDSDLTGKTPVEVVRRLTPTPVTPEQKVKTMNIVIDIERPLFVTTTGQETFMIGTTVVDGNVRDLQVNSDITLGTVKITKKR
jgi:hypothetical protein